MTGEQKDSIILAFIDGSIQYNDALNQLMAMGYSQTDAMDMLGPELINQITKEYQVPRGSYWKDPVWRLRTHFNDDAQQKWDSTLPMITQAELITFQEKMDSYRLVLYQIEPLVNSQTTLTEEIAELDEKIVGNPDKGIPPASDRETITSLATQKAGKRVSLTNVNAQLDEKKTKETSLRRDLQALRNKMGEYYLEGPHTTENKLAGSSIITGLLVGAAVLWWLGPPIRLGVSKRRESPVAAAFNY